jgi:hypothetical protein
MSGGDLTWAQRSCQISFTDRGQWFRGRAWLAESYKLRGRDHRNEQAEPHVYKINGCRASILPAAEEVSTRNPAMEVIPVSSVGMMNSDVVRRAGREAAAADSQCRR